MHRYRGGFLVFLLAAALTGLALWFCPVHFLLDDDYALMQIAAGFRSGVPSLYNVYENILFSGPISFLYTRVPGVPWYPLIELGILFLALHQILSATVRRASASGRALPVILLCVGALAAAFLPNLIFLQYSTVAAAAGAASVILMAERGDTENVHGFEIVFYAFLSFLIRREAGFVTLAFLGAAALMQRLSGKADAPRRKGFFHRALLPLLVSAMLICGAFFLQSTVEQSDRYRDYTAFNAARTTYMDYPPAEYDASSAYGKAGWSKSFFDLTERWFFLDDRFTAENLQGINADRPVGDQSVGDVIASFLSTLRVTNLVRNLFLLLTGLAGALTLRRALGRDFAGVFRGLVPYLGFLAASLFLCWSGRYPQHAFYVCALPALGLTLYEWAELPKAGLLSRGIGLAVLAAVLALSVSSTRHVYALANSQEYRAMETRNADVDAYCLAHPERAIITDYSVRGAGSPFATSRDAHPINRFFWGGWYYQTPFYKEQLAAVGLDGLDWRNFLEGNALLLNNDTELLGLFTQYLSEQSAAPVRAECIYTGLGFAAYAFTSVPQ